MLARSNSISARVILATLIAALVFGCGSSKFAAAGASGGVAEGSAAAASARPEPTDEAAIRLGELDLEAKAAQVLLVGIQGSGRPAEATLKFLSEAPVGGVILFGFNLPEKPADLGDYVGALQDAAAGNGSGLPILVAIDHEGGSVFRFKGNGITRIPPPYEVGKRGEAYASALGEAAGSELRALGVNMALAPVVELLDDENKRFLGSRSYGREAAIVDACAGAYIEGLQAKGVAAVAKHFPGNATEDPHKGLPLLKVDRETYERDYAPRFASAIGRGVAGVMLSHVEFDALDASGPATLSRPIVDGELKGRLGFRGVAVTDDLYMAALSERLGPERAAVAALGAGADLVMLSAMDGAAKVRAAIVEAVVAGNLRVERLDDAAKRVIELKIRFGMEDAFDHSARAERISGFEKLVEENGAKVKASSGRK